MKWETFEVERPTKDCRWQRFEFIARQGLREAIKSHELTELALGSCTDYRDHLGDVQQASRAAGLAGVLAALDHSFRWLGPQVIPKYRKQRYCWRKFGWLIGHLYGFANAFGCDMDQAEEEITFLANACLVRNQHAHYAGSIVGCPRRREVERWILREDSLWIDELGVICFAGDAVAKAFDNACSLLLFLTWKLREYEQG